MAFNYITVAYLKFFGSILVAAIAANVLGAFWYSNKGFGKTWQRLSGITDKQVEASKKGMAQLYAMNFAASIIASFVLAYIIGISGFNTILSGALIGLILAIGFGATNIGIVLWEAKPWRLYFLNNAYLIISFIIMGAMIGGMI